MTATQRCCTAVYVIERRQHADGNGQNDAEHNGTPANGRKLFLVGLQNPGVGGRVGAVGATGSLRHRHGLTITQQQISAVVRNFTSEQNGAD